MASMRRMKGGKFYSRIRWYLPNGKREEVVKLAETIKNDRLSNVANTQNKINFLNSEIQSLRKKLSAKPVDTIIPFRDVNFRGF